MKILSLETSSSGCSAALFTDGEIISLDGDEGFRHTEIILPLVNSVLADAGYLLSDLTAIAYDKGPGGFTGLRIGAGLAQGLALGADLPIIGISSLAAIAFSSGHHKVAAALDARMNEVYAGYYAVENGKLSATCAEKLIKPDNDNIPDESWFLAGNGWLKFAAIKSAPNRFDFALKPHAVEIAKLAANEPQTHWLPPEKALPVYLRKAV